MDGDRISTAAEREERILARRRRIQERINAKLEGEGGVSKKENIEEKETSKGKQQIVESRKRLYRLKLDGNDVVTSIRVVNDNRENLRQIDEEGQRQTLRAELLREAEKSARENASISLSWGELYKFNVPQELYKEIQQVKDSTQSVIDSKDELLDTLKTELKQKDDEYSKTLKRYAEDVDLLISNMGGQFRKLERAYQEELEEIEGAFLVERKEMVEGHKGEMLHLFEKRNQMEQHYMEAAQERAEQYQQQLEKLRQDDAEDYNILKIRLETDIQNLEQHLEAMRATYQLNTEKLEYNYRVLVERDQENQSTINQQKRKIARQRDLLSNLKNRYADSDKKFQEENLKLTEEYKRITEQFKDLQNKYKHFQAADMRKFEEVWNMNQETVSKIVDKVLQADKIIHEQQLGMEWVAPDKELFESPKDEPVVEEEDSDKASSDEVDLAKQLDEKLRDPQFKATLELLCSESKFLGSNQDAVAPAGTVEEAAKKILGALEISDGPGFDALMAILQKDETSSALVESGDVVKRLKLFVQSNLAATASAAASVGAKGFRLGQRQHVDKDRIYWERLANVISPQMFRIWGALEKNLQEYYKRLQERSALLNETQSLQKENLELQKLLQNYLNSKINEDLQIPPTKIM